MSNPTESKTESVFVRPPGKQPNVNTQMKTEDVTNTKGMSFNDFNLSQDLQLVSFSSTNFYCKFVNYLNLGHL